MFAPSPGTVAALLSGLSVCCITLFTVILILQGRRLSRQLTQSTAPAAGTLLIGSGAAIALTAMLVGSVPIPAVLRAPVIALAGLSCVIAFAAGNVRGRAEQCLAAITVVLVGFLPMSLVAFGPLFDPFGTHIGVLDFGGASAVFVVPAVAALVAGTLRPPIAPRSGACLKMVILLWLVSIGWLVCMELAIDEITPTIVTNALLMPPCGALAGVITERLRHGRTTSSSAAVGSISAVGASTAACAFLAPGIAVALALACGIVATVTSSSAPRTWRTFVITPLLCGSLMGVVLLGGLASDLGFIYNGQPELLFTQLVVALAAVLLGAASGGFLRLISRLFARSSAGQSVRSLGGD